MGKDGWLDTSCVHCMTKATLFTALRHVLELLTVVLKILYHAFSPYVQVIALQWQFTKQF